MNKINKDIKEKFEFFQELITLEKQVISTDIYLEPKRNNVRWLIGQSDVQHKSISDDVIFVVEKSKRDSKYGIKLKCNSLSKEPFVRFDSDGPAHRNDFLNIPLEEQSITTPHFNSFNENGLPFAFKNDTLKNDENAQIIVEDLNFGISLFCMETNSKLESGDFPIVIELSPELELGVINEVNFDNLQFD
jgi:hypothetical protein